MNEMLSSSYACPTSVFSSGLSAGEPVYSTLNVPVFGGEIDLEGDDEDFQYIDSVASGELKGWPNYPLFSQTDNLGSHAKVSFRFLILWMFNFNFSLALLSCICACPLLL